MVNFLPAIDVHFLSANKECQSPLSLGYALRDCPVEMYDRGIRIIDSDTVYNITAKFSIGALVVNIDLHG